MAAKAGAMGLMRWSGCLAIFMLLAWMLAAAAPAEATPLPATITENTTLTRSGSPYTGSTTISSGVALTVEPGVSIEGTLVVNGTLSAEGEAANPIFIRGTVKFEPGSGASVLSYVEDELGGGTNLGAIEIKSSSPTVSHSVIRASKGYGIKVSSGEPDIGHNEIINSSLSGIYYGYEGTNPLAINFHDNRLEKNRASGTIFVEAGSAFTGSFSAVSLGGNVVTNNTSTEGIYYHALSHEVPPDIANNQVFGNTGNDISVFGNLTKSATWSQTNPEFRLNSVVVKSGANLTLKPGFRSEGTLVVNGTLSAEGEAANPIFIRGTVKFEPGSGASVLSYVEVEEGPSTAGKGALEINASSPTIHNSTVAHSRYIGINILHGGAPEINNNHVFDSGEANIKYSAGLNEGGAIDIHNNLIEAGGGGVRVNVNGSTVAGDTLSGNTVTATAGVALSYEGPDIPADITQNTLESNASDDIQIAGAVGHSETWSVGGAPARFTGSGVTIPEGVTLSLQPGVYIRAPKLVVYGTLHAEGSPSRPVTLTGVSEEKGGEWSGINLEAGSGASILNYVEIGFGGSGGPMLNIKGSSPAITNSTFRRSAGDAIRVQQSGHPTLERNRFRDNHFGLRYEGEGKLQASNNDWGCANGPKPTGCGDEVTSNVEWRPAAVLQELPRLCPGTTMLSTSNACLLQKYEPLLKFDDEENYYADSAKEITDNWGDEETGLWGENKSANPYTNSLFDADSELEGPNYGLLAQSQPGVSWLPFQVTMSALGESYPNGKLADSNDWLDENNNYVEDAHRLEAAGYMNAAYGRAYTDALGKRWLEYWFWYYYNGKAVAGFGEHEGDWESVLVGLDANNRPEDVLLSQHTGAANCYIGEVEKTEEGGPVSYVALDSHANYSKAGSYGLEVGTDHADGLGPSAQPALTILDGTLPGWISWPGHWGNARAEIGKIESDSPTGPRFHEAWEQPEEYLEKAHECDSGYEGGASAATALSTAMSSPSIVSVAFSGRQPQVGYRVPRADGHGFWPRLRISVNELGDGGIPPVSRMISNVEARGRVTVPVRLRPGHAAEVLGSVFYKNGRRRRLAHRIVRVR